VSEAYDMLAGIRKSELSPDDFPQKLHTALLARSTDLSITASAKSSRGKGCVTASLDDRGDKGAVYFYVLDEGGQKRIHSIFTKDDFAAGGLAALEPWHCD
ncbi:MAG TPA: hypothetical protein VM925_21580, partial [Labilithrix sp.]|nr:hypothetical protein [Labilithrix sp.]